MNDHSTHTTLDREALEAADARPTQPRERAAACGICRRDTFNLEAFCDAHWRPPYAATR